jgi:hypothetical protein
MTLKPQPPFPKSRGDTVRSTDWNDLVTEVVNLDDVKVNRAGDTMTGPLTVAGALGIGVAAATDTPRADRWRRSISAACAQHAQQ